jgi:hypothetical protein
MKRIRVNLRLPEDLVRWAKRHSKSIGGTFTNTVEYGLRTIQVKIENSELSKRKRHARKASALSR